VNPGGHAGARGVDDLLHHLPGLRTLGCLGRVQECPEFGLDDLRDQPGDRRCAQHLFGLALELRFGQSHGDDRGHPLQHVVLDDVVAALEQPGAVEPAQERLQQTAFETLNVGAALGRGDDIDEGAFDHVITGSPTHGDVHEQVAFDIGGSHRAVLVQHRDRLGERLMALNANDIGDRRIGGQVVGELRDAAVVPELLGRRLFAALIGDDEFEPGHQEAGLAGALDQVRQGQLGAGQEDLPIGPVTHPGSGDTAAHLADLAQSVLSGERGVRPLAVENAGSPATEAHRPDCAVAVDLDVQPGAERIHH